MLRSIRILAITFLIPLVAIGQIKSDRERANLLGPVKSIGETYTRYKNAKPEQRDTVIYDQKGNEIERSMVSDFGEPMGKQLQTFDSAGLLKESKWIDAKGRGLEKYSFSYTDGKLIETLIYDKSAVLREKTVRTYDTNGKLIKETYFDPTIARAETVYTNDAPGNAVEIAFYLTGGKKASAPIGPCLGAHRVTFGYDDKGRAISKSAFETDGRQKKSWTYAYDDHGNMTLYVVKSGSLTTTMSYSYEYDARGNWIKRTSIYRMEDPIFDRIFEASGKTPTPEEKKKMEEEKAKYAPSPEITIREIIYY